MLKLSRKITISVNNIFPLSFCFPVPRTSSETEFRFENCLRLSSAEILHNNTVLLNVSNNLTFYFPWIFSAIDKCMHSQYGIYDCIGFMHIFLPVNSWMVTLSRTLKDVSNLRGWLQRWQTKLTCMVQAGDLYTSISGKWKDSQYNISNIL